MHAVCSTIAVAAAAVALHHSSRIVEDLAPTTRCRRSRISSKQTGRERRFRADNGVGRRRCTPRSPIAAASEHSAAACGARSAARRKLEKVG
jgi:hypothetical protein